MRLAMLVAAILLTLSCASANVPTEPPKGTPDMTLTLTSSAFSEGGTIPRDYTCDGANRQLPVAWSGVPEGTAELALVMDDPDANGYVHWVVTGIPAGTTSIADQLPAGVQSGQPYRGPCPPSGTHRYVLTLYALSAPLGAAASTSSQVRSAAADKTLAAATLTGRYTRGASS
jgi:hypothetical protein